MHSWHHINLPPYDGEDWALWKKGKIEHLNPGQIASRLKRWQPQTGVLIAEPGGPNFVSPLEIPLLADGIFTALRRRGTALVFTCVISAVLAICFWCFNPEALLPLGISSSLMLLAVMFYCEYFIFLKSINAVSQRTRYLYWINTDISTKVASVFWSSLVALIGVVQFRLTELIGFDEVFHRYGFIYSDVRQGEVWRAFTGPFLHFSMLHYLINALLLIMIGVVTWMALGGVMAISVFLVGNVAGAYGQMYLGGDLFDNCAGISAGVYALFGLVIVSSYLNRKLLPRGLSVLFLIAAVIGILSSEVSFPNAATASHLVGFVTGSVLGALYWLPKQLFRFQR